MTEYMLSALAILFSVASMAINVIIIIKVIREEKKQN